MAISGAMGDPYTTLGVPTDASTATIRSSYKKLMLQCHPDKVHDESQRAEKAAQFTKVQEAYELLSDQRRRRKYDEEVARGTSAGGAARAAGSAAHNAEADRAKSKDRERAERQRRKPRPPRAENAYEAEAEARAEHTRHQREAREAQRAAEMKAREQARNAGYAQAREETIKREHARYEEASSRPRSHPPRPSHPESRPSHTESRPSHPESRPSQAPPTQSQFTAPPRPSPFASAQVHPEPPLPCPSPAARPGYKDSVEEENSKIAAVKARIKASAGDEESAYSHSPPKSSRRERSREGPDPEVLRAKEAMRQRAYEAELSAQMDREREAAAARMFTEESARLASIEAEQQRIRKENIEKRRIAKEEREQRERPRRERPNRSGSSDIGLSTSPPHRRPSHTAPRGHDVPATPPRAFTSMYGQSAPLSSHNFPSNPRSPPGLRRRNSISESPSLEKMQAKQRDSEMRRSERIRREEPEALYDSGYSSPSPDTPNLSDETVPDGPLDAANGGQPPGWKRFTFDVLVQESEAGSQVHQNSPQHPRSRRKASGGSPQQHAAEPYGPGLPPNFSPDFAENIARATGILGGKNFYVEPHPPSSIGGGVPIDHGRYASSPMYPSGSYPPQHPTSSGNYTHSPATSHASHSSRESPRMRPSRTARAANLANSPHSSPKLPAEGFTPTSAPLSGGIHRSYTTGGSGSSTGPLNGGSGYYASPSGGSSRRTHGPAPGSYGPNPMDSAPPTFNRYSTWHSGH